MSIRSNIVPEWTVDPRADFDPHEDCSESPCDDCRALEESNLCPDCSGATIYGPDFEGFLDCGTCGAAWKPEPLTV